MHSLVRRYLKTAIVFLGVGLAIGIWMMAERELIGRFPGAYETSAHTHAILVGFVMMMILGVALWLFPRPARDDTRYEPRIAETAYWLLTLGTAARVGGEIARPFTGSLHTHRHILRGNRAGDWARSFLLRDVVAYQTGWEQGARRSRRAVLKGRDVQSAHGLSVRDSLTNVGRVPHATSACPRRRVPDASGNFRL